MKTYLNVLIILFSLFITTASYGGIYDDWPDEAICLWLELRPNHEGYLAENKKRTLNKVFNIGNFNTNIILLTKKILKITKYKDVNVYHEKNTNIINDILSNSFLFRGLY